MKSYFLKIIKLSIIIISITLIVACSKTSNSSNEIAPANNINNEVEEFKNPDNLEGALYILSPKVITILEKDDFYEIQNVCLAKDVNYDYDYEKFRFAKVGDTLTLPNGKFLVEGIEHIGDETAFSLYNKYFWQDVRINNKDKSVYFWSTGFLTELESVYIGNIKISKDAIYNKLIIGSGDFHYKKMTFSEALQDKTFKENMPLSIINGYNENNDIIEMTEMFIP